MRVRCHPPIRDGEQRGDGAIATGSCERCKQRLHHRDDAAEAGALHHQAETAEEEPRGEAGKMRHAQSSPHKWQAEGRQEEPDSDPLPRADVNERIEVTDSGGREAMHGRYAHPPKNPLAVCGEAKVRQPEHDARLERAHLSRDDAHGCGDREDARVRPCGARSARPLGRDQSLVRGGPTSVLAWCQRE